MSSVAGPRDASDLDHCLLVVLDLKIPGPRYRTDSDLELSVSHGEFDDVREMDDPGPETGQARKKKNLHTYTHIRIERYIQVGTMGRRPGV